MEKNNVELIQRKEYQPTTQVCSEEQYENVKNNYIR